MWTPIRYTATKTRTYPEMGGHDFTTLLGDGLELFAGAECVCWGFDWVQIHLCMHCGREGCQMGGYVHVRRARENVLFFPLFDELKERGQFICPPPFMESRGVLFYPPAEYAALGQVVARLPAANTLEPLELRECARIAKWEVEHVLRGNLDPGTGGEAWDALTVCSPAMWDTFAKLMAQAWDSSEPAILTRLAHTDAEVIRLGAAPWPLLAIEGTRAHLLLSPDWLVANCYVEL